MTSDERAGPDGALKRRPSGPRSVLGWLFYLAPPLLLMVLIFVLGDERAGSDRTGTLLELLFRTLAPAVHARMTPDQLAVMNFAFRKAAHFFGYGLLGVLNARAALGLRGALEPRHAAAAWAAAVLWAAVDEFHQSFSSTRGASPADVVLDGTGAAACITLYSLWIARRKRTS